ncbi:MAG: gamma-glutamyl-gamma-aminobutyrate hydrolase family protein [Planctomycetes bacterium]|nr:gamma-glutamyl-gamma-aminobutyrate hydrolase family protein [Planctomycetota bacterium]
MAGKYLLEINQQFDNSAPDSVVTPFLEWGVPELESDRLRRDPASIRVVFFTGGADVSPSLYGERPGSHTRDVDGARDEQERQLFRMARAANIPMIGICRGAQFLCVMAGGRVCQHLEGHVLERDQSHGIRALDVHGEILALECSSKHHQMQLPPAEAEVLAWAEPRLAGGRYLNGDDRPLSPDIEYEAIYYPQIQALGVQWHPEWMARTHPCVAYTRRIAADRLRL